MASYTLTAPYPASGDVTAKSKNFTINTVGSPNGLITISPSGGGLTQSIPITINAATGTYTFSITPSSIGTITLYPTNNAAMSNPAPVQYLSMIQIGTVYNNPNVSSSYSPSYGGYNWFASGVWWQEFSRDISNDAVDPFSVNYMARFGSTLLQLDFSNQYYGMPFNIVSGTTPRVPVICTVLQDPAATSAPIPSYAAFENYFNNGIPPSGYNDTADHHLLVVARDEVTGVPSGLYEYYSIYTLDSGNSYIAGYGVYWSMLDYKPRMDDGISADAAGLCIHPLTMRYDEVANGTLNHALRCTLPFIYGYVWPARGCSNSGGTFDAAAGDRLRLTAAWYNANSGNYSGQALTIINAMRKYGMINADATGGFGLGVRLEGVPDSRWDPAVLAALHGIPASGFEIIKRIPAWQWSWNGSNYMRPGGSQTLTAYKYPYNDLNYASNLYFDNYLWPYFSFINILFQDSTGATSGSSKFTPPGLGTYTITAHQGNQDWLYKPDPLYFYCVDPSYKTNIKKYQNSLRRKVK